MEAPPQPLGPLPGARHDGEEEEDETCFAFLASLAAAATSTSSSDSSSSRSMKVALSLLPASPDFMAFQGFVSLGVGVSKREERAGLWEGKHVVAPDRRSNVVILPLTVHAFFPFLHIYTATSIAPGLFLRDPRRACPLVVPPRGCSAAGAVGAGRVVEPGTVGARGRKKGGRGREKRGVGLRNQQVVKCACCSNEWKWEGRRGRGRRKKQSRASHPNVDNTTHKHTAWSDATTSPPSPPSWKTCFPRPSLPSTLLPCLARLLLMPRLMGGRQRGGGGPSRHHPLSIDR